MTAPSYAPQTLDEYRSRGWSLVRRQVAWGGHVRITVRLIGGQMVTVLVGNGRRGDAAELEAITAEVARTPPRPPPGV